MSRLSLPFRSASAWEAATRHFRGAQTWHPFLPQMGSWPAERTRRCTHMLGRPVGERGECYSSKSQALVALPSMANQSEGPEYSTFRRKAHD